MKKDDNQYKLFIENWRGCLLVHTNLPFDIELFCFDTGTEYCDIYDSEMFDYRNTLISRNELHDLHAGTQWFVTDDDCLQCCRMISQQCYELIQVQKLRNDYGVLHGIVNIDDYSVNEWEEYIKIYGHSDLHDFIASYENRLEYRVLAEYIFETDWQKYLLEKTYKTRQEAEKHIGSIVDCKLS